VNSPSAGFDLMEYPRRRLDFWDNHYVKRAIGRRAVPVAKEGYCRGLVLFRLEKRYGSDGGFGEGGWRGETPGQAREDDVVEAGRKADGFRRSLRGARGKGPMVEKKEHKGEVRFAKR